MSEVEELAVRRQMVDDLRAMGIDPYPAHVSRTHSAAEALAAFDDSLTDEEIDRQPTVTVAGRMVTQRIQGKAGFAHLQDASGRIQIYCRLDTIGEEEYALFKRLHPGDFVWATGKVFRPLAPQIRVRVAEIPLIPKRVRP